MSKKILAAVLATASFFAGVQNAQAADNLFKSYVYDTSIASYTEAAGYYDCSADLGVPARCIDDVDFIGEKFTAALIFSSDKLSMVSLLAPFDRDLYGRAFVALAKSFGLVALSDGKSVLDLVELAGKAKSKDEYTTKIKNYESVGLSSNDLTYTFFEGVTSLKAYSSVHNLMTSVPANTRSAELLISGEGEESSIVIRFSFPGLDGQKFIQEAKKPVESF